MKVLKEIEINGRKIKVVLGDITKENTEAIVNAANSLLKHGGGVAGAIVRKGGMEIQRESDEIVRKRGPVPVGSSVYTGAGKLKAKYVIHTVGPVWGEGNEEEKLRNAVKSALKLADDLKVSSVALPAISTGIFGYPKEEGTRVIFEEVVNFLKRDSHLKEVHLISIDEETANIFLKHAENFLRRRGK